MHMPSYDWVDQLEPLVRELEAIAGGERRLVAVTVAVPRGAPLDTAARLLEEALAYAGHDDVQVTARQGITLQVLAAEFLNQTELTRHAAPNRVRPLRRVYPDDDEGR